MTEKDLLAAFSDVDERLVDHAATALEGRGKRTRVMRAVIAWAAALCLVVAGTVGMVLYQRTVHSLPLLDHTVHPEQITGKQSASLLEGGSLSVNEASYPAPLSAYREAYVITAQVMEVLPDVYQRLPASTYAYKVLRLKVLEEINSTGMPEEIYFLYPAEYMADFSTYSEIIFAIKQLGIENYLLYNQTDRCVEPFTLLFEFWTNPIFTTCGSMLPFTNGTLDERIWENGNWRNGKENVLEFLEEFTGNADCSLENFKAAVESQTYYPDCPVITQVSLDFDAANKVFAYVEPFVNGTFMQEESYPGDPPAISYIRLINGFRTEERIVISSKDQTVAYSDERYTAEDLQNVPDLGALIEILEKKKLTPPHLDTEGMEQRGGEITGWYRKVDGKIYGIVKAEWLFFDPEQRQYYRDDLYFLATQDGTYREVSREKLRSVIGEDYYIDSYPHGESVNISVP